MEQLIAPIAETLKITVAQVKNTLSLLEEGNTVPFIARYRKEMTKGLDEEEILYISKQYEYQVNLEKRKQDVLRIIETQGKLSQEIIDSVNQCTKLSEIEDIYRPYQQKRKTRATEAVRKGLEPLAKYLLSLPKDEHYLTIAKNLINDEVLSVEDALQGAKDIIAEMVSDKAELRQRIKTSILNYGKISTKVKKNHNDEANVYKMYYDYQERVQTIQPHRIMAIERAENEKVITVTMDYDKGWLVQFAIRGLTKNRETSVLSILEEAADDGLKRLAFPSVEREIRSELKAFAQTKSIEIFSMNVEKLIMQPPLIGKMILGVDPAFRTGCKLAVINATGKMEEIVTIYQNAPVFKVDEAKMILLKIMKKYPIEVIAIGNGTASRETEKFIVEFIKENNLNVVYTIVSEAGASVYSASDLARKEFPDLQVEQRSAISIARRLLDPLAELIKIDPKSIGVGQYQHDLPPKELEERLDFAISKSVNRVGADLNTASEELLLHISGLTKTTAKNIIDYRNQVGLFTTRKELSKVAKLGPKAIEQAAGFLRINEGIEPLDKTSIHPESYKVAKTLLKLIKQNEIGSESLVQALSTLDLDALAKEMNVDLYTLNDIVDALKMPLRDYREQYDGPLLKQDVLSLEDLKVGDQLEGVVRNVVDFGAFVDIGLKEDGLIHISKLSKVRVKHPSDVVAIGDILTVYIYQIDFERHKVQLSLIEG